MTLAPRRSIPRLVLAAAFAASLAGGCARSDDSATLREIAAVAGGLDEALLASWASGMVDDAAVRAEDALAEGAARIDAALARSVAPVPEVSQAWTNARERIDAATALRRIVAELEHELREAEHAAKLAALSMHHASVALVAASERAGSDAKRIARQIHLVSQATSVLQRVPERAAGIVRPGPALFSAADGLSRDMEHLRRVYDGMLAGDAELGLDRIDDEDARAAFEKSAQAYGTLRPHVDAALARVPEIAGLEDAVFAANEAANELVLVAERAARVAAR